MTIDFAFRRTEVDRTSLTPWNNEILGVNLANHVILFFDANELKWKFFKALTKYNMPSLPHWEKLL